MILATLGMAVSYTSAAPAKAPATTSDGEFVSLGKIGARDAQSLYLHSPTAETSLADIVGSDQPYKMLLRNKVVVRMTGMKNVRALIDTLPDELGPVVLEGSLGNMNDAWELTTKDVRSAIAVAELLSSNEQVRAAFVDSGKIADRPAMNEMVRMRSLGRPVPASVRSQFAPGIKPVDGEVDPAGTTDPDIAQFWHYQNADAFYLDHDNNITSAIYDTMGFDGTGITVGLARFSNLEHLDFNHTEIDDNYDAVLTMPIDTTLFPPDRSLTSYAGIIAGERDNGEGGHGIAPGAKFATMSTGTAMLLANMLTYEYDSIDVKVIPSPGLNEFTSMNFASSYNQGAIEDFVGDSFVRALKFGRNKKGSILVFSGGFGFSFMNPYPDPYDSDKSGSGGLDLSAHGGIDELFLGNVLEIIDEDEGGIFSVTTPAIGPTYITSQTYMYPFANDRRTFLINGVSEDGNADLNQAIGPGVFASVFSGTSNVSTFWNNGLGANAPQGIFSTVPGSVLAELPNTTDDYTITVPQFFDVVEASGNSAAIAGGIIALMLDANPSLTIRDIQHILFESIFESTRATNIKFPIFDPFRVYIGPQANSAADPTNPFDPAFGRYSFWQVNSALHELPTGGVAAIRHSDQFGFGVIDAELAVSKAETWGGAPRLVLLDTGRIDEDSEVRGISDPRIPLEIIDAEYIVLDETATFLRDGFGQAINQINFCVRPNLVIESIVVELSATGSGFNDIFTTLTSPWGTSSNLSYPTTSNSFGTSFPVVFNDDDFDDAVYSVGTLGTDEMALINHEFTTFKHWGELSGGTWRLDFYDFGPDEGNQEGTASTDTDPAVPNIHTLGAFGLPGSEFRDTKEVVSFRVKIYGYDSGEEAFLGCDPFATSCPGDLNGDGVIDAADFNLFLSWWMAGDMRADINGNGQVEFFDISAYQGIFLPGFCTIGGGAPPHLGGRPQPGGADASDNNPPTRPI